MKEAMSQDPQQPAKSDDPLDAPHRLLTLINVSGASSPWLPGELGAILSHQLDSPLRDALPVDVGEARDEKMTLRMLFEQTAPPVALVEQLKRAMKSASVDPESFLPREVATALYIAALVAGLRAGHRLSSLADEAIQERARWAQSREWLDPTLRGLLDDYLSDKE